MHAQVAEDVAAALALGAPSRTWPCLLKLAVPILSLQLQQSQAYARTFYSTNAQASSSHRRSSSSSSTSRSSDVQNGFTGAQIMVLLSKLHALEASPRVADLTTPPYGKHSTCCRPHIRRNMHKCDVSMFR